MKTNTSKKNGLIVGAIFSVCSFLLTYTVIVPGLSLFSGAIFESISKAIVPNEPYSNVGKLTITLLAVVLLSIIFFCINHAKQLALAGKTLSKGKIALFMFVFYLIVHPLGFYIYWGLKINFRSDGQLAFAIVDSFPFSSMTFVLFGLLIDRASQRAVLSQSDR